MGLIRSIVKRAAVLMLAAAVLLCALSCSTNKTTRKQSFTIFDIFDTVITVTVYTDDDALFAKLSEETKALFTRYHRLFDVYNEYEGSNNLACINRLAGQSVKTEPEILELLSLGREYEELTGGAVNIAMGAVLRLWHASREAAQADPENAGVPAISELEEAAKHCNINDVVLDPEACTVTLRDPLMSIDVGAIAKGFAADKAAELLKAYDVPFLMNCGGAVLTGGNKPDGSAWKAGINDPKGSSDEFAATVSIEDGALSTSGSYLRSFTVAGKEYGHIIDPATLMPAEGVASVSVLCRGAGGACLADALSTACFILGVDRSKSILSAAGAEALFIECDGEIVMTEAFPIAE